MLEERYALNDELINQLHFMIKMGRTAFDERYTLCDTNITVEAALEELLEARDELINQLPEDAATHREENARLCFAIMMINRRIEEYQQLLDETIDKQYGLSDDNTVNDAVTPEHYHNSEVMEPFEIIKKNKSAWIGFCYGNIIKYVQRYDRKNGVEDLKKAKVYLEELIEVIE